MGKVKQAQKDRASSILVRLLHGESVNDASDHQFLTELLSKHPKCEEKIGKGIASFQCNELYENNRCFNVVRIDGSAVSFSVKACLQAPSYRADALQAFRTVIAPQSKAFWAEYKANTPIHDRLCPITGEFISEENHAVDHSGDNAFHVIVDKFLLHYGLDVKTLRYTNHPAIEFFYYPEDAKIREDFLDFHRRNACLRVLSKQGNSLVEIERRRMSSKALTRSISELTTSDDLSEMPIPRPRHTSDASATNGVPSFRP
jgi:hypothetical protein